MANVKRTITVSDIFGATAVTAIVDQDTGEITRVRMEAVVGNTVEIPDFDFFMEQLNLFHKKLKEYA